MTQWHKLVKFSDDFFRITERNQTRKSIRLFVNCRNHRLALCLVHLIKRYPVLQEIDSTLLALWNLFEFSPQKLAVFKHIQSVYGKEPLTILRAATTRWLSHLHAPSRFISRYYTFFLVDQYFSLIRQSSTFWLQYKVRYFLKFRYNCILDTLYNKLFTFLRVS